VLLSTLVLRKHFREKSECGPPKCMYTVINCWDSALSLFISTRVSRPFKPQHITIYCTKSSKTYLKSNLVISACTLQLPHKKKTVCTLDPCQMDNPFRLLWSHFLLFFTTVHMLQNIITIIPVHYHTSLKNSLSVIYYFC